MAARRLYDPPAAQLVELLREARAEGLSFMDAWVRALRPGLSIVMSTHERVPAGAIRWPTDRTDREASRAALIATRETWRRAYENEPELRRERRVVELASIIGLDEGLRVGVAVPSAA